MRGAPSPDPAGSLRAAEEGTVPLCPPRPPLVEDSPGTGRGHLSRPGAQRNLPRPRPPRSPVTRPQHQRHLLLRRRHRHEQQRQPPHLPERWGLPRPCLHPSHRRRRHHSLGRRCLGRRCRGRSGDRRPLPPPEIRPAPPLARVQACSPNPQMTGQTSGHSGPLLFTDWLYVSPGACAPNRKGGRAELLWLPQRAADNAGIKREWGGAGLFHSLGPPLAGLRVSLL